MATKRNCSICGKEYEYCPKCAQYETMPKWYINYCGEDCKNLDRAINQYVFGHIKANEAAPIVNKVANVINEEIVSIINKINEETKPKVGETESVVKKPLKKKTTVVVNED